MISIFSPFVSASAHKYISQSLADLKLSEGSLVQKFESKLEEFGIQNAVCVNSGTSALFLALKLLGIESGDEVILPSQTFIATGLSILQSGAKPVFCDIELNTGNIDASKLEALITSKTRAIISVDWGGYPCDYDTLQNIAREHNIFLISDAAHSILSEYKDRLVGTIADITCFSFQAIKHLTTGDGGALSFKNPQFVRRAKSLRWFGIDRSCALPTELGEREYDLTELGYKLHLNDYAASLGLANAFDLQSRIEARRAVARFYDLNLRDVSGIKLFEYSADRISSYWLYGCHVENRLDFIRSLKQRGIQASVVHLGITKYSIFRTFIHPHYSDENQTKFDKTQVYIPIHDKIDLDTAAKIVESIKGGW